MKYKLVFVCFLFALSSLSAQKLELTQEEKTEFKNRAERMIKLFTETLTVIPSFNSDTEERILRDKAIRNTLRLFTKTATMQIMLANGTKRTSPMPTYLNSLTDYEAKRELVHIDIIEFNVDAMRPHPTQLGSYIVSFEFVQRFSKKKNYTPDPFENSENLKQMEWDYVDITTKSGSAIVKKHTDQSGTKWIMLLDDVEANDIEVVKN
ncbi:MAG: hypothetical protein WDZ45_11265 [Flavobacteriaceae bacterium]